MLSGSKVSLRAWDESDLPALIVLRNDTALQAQLMTQPRPNSRERVIEWLSEKSSREDGVFFVVTESATNNAVGYVQVLNINRLHGFADLGICLAPAVHGKGYGREAIALLEAYLQHAFALRKLMLQVLAENQAAVRLYLRSGFREVGRMLRHFYLDGVYRDVLVMEKQLG